MQSKKRVIHCIALTAVYASCLYIAWNVPYAHDDWDWGLDIGFDRWLSGELNNRYIGTFFVLVMTRNPLIKTAIMGSVMFLIPLLSARLADGGYPERRFPLFLACTGFLFAVPMYTWNQTFGWVSAFSNFLVPCVPLLALLLLSRSAWKGQHGWWLPISLFVLALICQLFAENLTVVLAGMATIFVAYACWKHRAVAAAFALFIGAFAGLILMFWNPLYRELLSTGTAVYGIRRLAVSSENGLGQFVLEAVRRTFLDVLPALLESAPAIWAFVCAGVAWRMVRNGRPLTIILCAGFLCTVVLWFVWQIVNLDRLSRPLPVFYSFLRPVAPIVILLFLFIGLWTDQDKIRRPIWLSLLLTALALVAPFSVLADLGPRCCFISLILILVLSLSLLSDFPWRSWGTAGATVLSVVVLVFHLRVYAVIGGCSALRESLLQEALTVGAEQVLLPIEGLEFAYCWGRNPQSELRADYFRQFYGLPSELALVFLPRGSYELWPDIPKEMINDATVY